VVLKTKCHPFVVHLPGHDRFPGEFDDLSLKVYENRKNPSVRDANVTAEKQQEEKSKAPAIDNLQIRQSGKINKQKMIQLLQRIHLLCKPAAEKPCSPKTGRRAPLCGRHSRSAGIPLLHNRAIALPSRGTIREVQEKSLSSRKRVEELLRLMQRASTRH